VPIHYVVEAVCAHRITIVLLRRERAPRMTRAVTTSVKPRFMLDASLPLSEAKCRLG
jgi:hypothetical protein